MNKEFQEVLIGIYLGEEGLVEVLEGKVEGLGGEVPDDVGQVASPELLDSFLSDDSLETVSDSGVSLSGLNDSLIGVLGLKNQFDSFNWS